MQWLYIDGFPRFGRWEAFALILEFATVVAAIVTAILTFAAWWMTGLAPDGMPWNGWHTAIVVLPFLTAAIIAPKHYVSITWHRGDPIYRTPEWYQTLAGVRAGWIPLVWGMPWYAAETLSPGPTPEYWPLIAGAVIIMIPANMLQAD